MLYDLHFGQFIEEGGNVAPAGILVPFDINYLEIHHIISFTVQMNQCDGVKFYCHLKQSKHVNLKLLKPL